MLCLPHILALALHSQGGFNTAVPGLGALCRHGADDAALEGDNTMTGEKKYALYKLADRISKGGAVEVTSEEIATLKERIAKTYGNIIVIGAAFDALETDYTEPSEG